MKNKSQRKECKMQGKVDQEYTGKGSWWLSPLSVCLSLAQVVISESWDEAPH